MHESMHVCFCHIFTSIVISHSFMKISSPDLQRMFMAVKICLQNILPHFKNNMTTIVDCSKLIDMFYNLKYCS